MFRRRQGSGCRRPAQRLRHAHLHADGNGQARIKGISCRHRIDNANVETRHKEAIRAIGPVGAVLSTLNEDLTDAAIEENPGGFTGSSLGLGWNTRQLVRFALVGGNDTDQRV